VVCRIGPSSEGGKARGLPWAYSVLKITDFFIFSCISNLVVKNSKSPLYILEKSAFLLLSFALCFGVLSPNGAAAGLNESAFIWKEGSS